jgi:hypothetical protein
MSHTYELGKLAFKQGSTHNPFATPHPWAEGRVDWQRGYDDAKNEHQKSRKAVEVLDQWRYLPASYRAMHELEQALSPPTAALVKALVEAMINEALNPETNE